MCCRELELNSDRDEQRKKSEEERIRNRDTLKNYYYFIANIIHCLQSVLQRTVHRCKYHFIYDQQIHRQGTYQVRGKRKRTKRKTHRDEVKSGDREREREKERGWEKTD